MSTVCGSCGSPASGIFCSQCGEPLSKVAVCKSCNAQLLPGARFCNQCGAAVTGVGPSASVAPTVPSEAPAAPAAAGSKAAWVVAGVAIAALAVTVILPRLGDSDEPQVAAPAVSGTAAGASGIDITSMTPREAADRLFNRVMTSASTGDSAEARAFAPMAVSAYGLVQDLDLDGRYHVAALHLILGDAEAASQEADSILGEVPTHLYGLFTAAQAADLRGDRQAADSLYRRFLDSYDSEMAAGRVEYSDHGALPPSMREEALSRLTP